MESLSLSGWQGKSERAKFRFIRPFIEPALLRYQHRPQMIRHSNIVELFLLKKDCGYVDPIKPDFVVDWEKRQKEALKKELKRAAPKEEEAKKKLAKKPKMDDAAEKADESKATTEGEQRRYGSPRKTRSIVNYAELSDGCEDIIFERPHFTLDGRENILCYECDDYIVDGCPEHPLYFIDDAKAKRGHDDYAHKSCPSMLRIAKSRIAGKGVFAVEALDAGTAFGPYQGRQLKLRTTADKSGYAWEVATMEGPRFIDGKDQRLGNWMRFVNHGEADQPQCVAMEYGGSLYYVVTRSVKKGAELLVNYGAEYGRELRAFRPTKMLVKPAIVHVADGGAGFKCPDCPSHVPFSTAALLAQHRERCHSIRHRFPCPVCGKKFTESGSLKTHLLVHTGEKPFKCTACGKAFNQKPHLINHERMHTGERPFICAVCQKGFTKTNDLRRHERVHSGETPFCCQHCGRRFKDEGTCLRHQKICRSRAI